MNEQNSVWKWFGRLWRKFFSLRAQKPDDGKKRYTLVIPERVYLRVRDLQGRADDPDLSATFTRALATYDCVVTHITNGGKIMFVDGTGEVNEFDPYGLSSD